MELVLELKVMGLFMLAMVNLLGLLILVLL